jgi:hypothetical protein
MGFGERFLKWISVLLYTANTKVVVNGMPGERIHHARGLRQGDPTSPLLFVAAMEVLTTLFDRAVEDHILNNLASIRQSRGSPYLRMMWCVFSNRRGRN